MSTKESKSSDYSGVYTGIFIMLVLVLGVAAFQVVIAHYNAAFVWSPQYDALVYIPPGERVVDFNDGITLYEGSYFSTIVVIDRDVPNTTVILRVVEPIDSGSFDPIPPVLRHNTTYKDHIALSFIANPCVSTKIIGEFRNETSRWFEVFTIGQSCACL